MDEIVLLFDEAVLKPSEERFEITEKGKEADDWQSGPSRDSCPAANLSSHVLPLNNINHHYRLFCALFRRIATLFAPVNNITQFFVCIVSSS